MHTLKTLLRSSPLRQREQRYHLSISHSLQQVALAPDQTILYSMLQQTTSPTSSFTQEICFMAISMTTMSKSSMRTTMLSSILRPKRICTKMYLSSTYGMIMILGPTTVMVPAPLSPLLQNHSKTLSPMETSKIIFLRMTIRFSLLKLLKPQMLKAAPAQRTSTSTMIPMQLMIQMESIEVL